MPGTVVYKLGYHDEHKETSGFYGAYVVVVLGLIRLHSGRFESLVISYPEQIDLPSVKAYIMKENHPFKERDKKNVQNLVEKSHVDRTKI